MAQDKTKDVRLSSVGTTQVLEHNTAWDGVSYC